jgi:hypothetical protein
MGQIVPIGYDYIPSDFFTWSENTGITEDSTLNANGFEDMSASNVIIIKSHRTGKFMAFIYQKEEIDDDGGTVAWHYKSGEGVELIILND